MDKSLTINNNIVKIFDTPNQGGAWLASEIIAQALLVKVGKYSISLPGGTSPIHLFNNLALQTPDGVKIRQILWFWGDERCVAHTHEQSNFKLADDYLFSKIPFNYAYAFRIWGEDNPAEESKRYQRVIENILPLVDNIPQFDAIVLGIGADGHTASIFPNQMELLSTKELVSQAIHPQTEQIRVSATGKLINNAKNIYFFVNGKDKAAVVAQILRQNGDYLHYPASHIKAIAGNTFWILDKEAASELKL